MRATLLNRFEPLVNLFFVLTLLLSLVASAVAVTETTRMYGLMTQARASVSQSAWVGAVPEACGLNEAVVITPQNG